jgi:hypothetical protein
MADREPRPAGRTRARLGLRRAALLLLLAPTAAAGPSLDARIEEAVRRGAAFLLSRYDPGEGWGGALGTGTYGNVGRPYPYNAGPSALACYALLKAGVPPDDPTLRRAFGFLRSKYRSPGVTYEQAVLLLAVAERGGARRSPDFRRGALREQRTLHRFQKPKESPFATADWTWMADLAKQILRFQARNGGWRYYPNDFHSGGRADVSSTQFALLALATASRCGYAVPEEAFRRARAFLLLQQAADGPAVPRGVFVAGGEPGALDRARGFPYIADSDVPAYRRLSGGMTAAGVSSLLLLREELGADEGMEQAILDGYAWLGRYLTVHVNPGYAPFLTGSYHYAWLYALERCGDLGAREVIGGRTWFFEGAEVLLAAQGEDGAFPDVTCMNPQDVLGTSFALLFLTRAHRPVSGGG